MSVVCECLPRSQYVRLPIRIVNQTPEERTDLQRPRLDFGVDVRFRQVEADALAERVGDGVPPDGNRGLAVALHLPIRTSQLSSPLVAVIPVPFKVDRNDPYDTPTRLGTDFTGRSS